MARSWRASSRMGDTHSSRRRSLALAAREGGGRGRALIARPSMASGRALRAGGPNEGAPGPPIDAEGGARWPQQECGPCLRAACYRAFELRDDFIEGFDDEDVVFGLGTALEVDQGATDRRRLWVGSLSDSGDRD